MRSEDPLNDGVSDLVVDRPVVGTADEELVLMGEDQIYRNKPKERPLIQLR